jgi:hypothetical protein
MDSVSKILNETDLRHTFLRQFSKEELIQAILEMRKASVSETVRLKELDYQLKLVEKEIELKRIDASMSGSGQIAEAVLEYANLVKDHDYGPMAVKSLSNSLSNVYTKFAPTPASQPPPEPSEADLEERVKLALSQGLKWNKSGKRPEKLKTLQKKLEEWENALEEGRKAEEGDYAGRDYDSLVSAKGCESYVLGICEQVEARRGLQPSSKYLRVRYKHVSETLQKAPTTPSNPSAPISPLSVSKDLVQRLLGPIESVDRRAAILSKYVEKNMSNVRAIGAEALRAVVCNKHSPIVFKYDRDRPDCDQVEKYQSVKVHKKYDDKLQDFLDSYCDEKGL